MNGVSSPVRCGPGTDATKDRLRTAQQLGQIGDVDLDVAAELLYGPIYYRWLLRTGPTSREHADTVVRLTLRALSWTPPSSRAAINRVPSRRSGRR